VLNAWVNVSISPYAMLRALLVAIAIAVAITLLGWLIMRDLRRSALFGSLVVGFVVVGREVAIIVRNTVDLLPPWQTAILAAAFAAAIAIVGILAWRWSRRAGGLGQVRGSPNRLAAVLLVVIVVLGVLDGTAAQAFADVHQGVPLDSAPDRSRQPRQGPDIYVILLDGYARADVLNDQFNFDNTPFLGALEERGFEVAAASHSNYLLTQLTITSFFEMELLHEVAALKPLIDTGLPDQPLARRVLNDNPTFEYLRARGYAIAALAASYEAVTLRQADVLMDAPQVNEFEWHLLASTFVLDLVDWIAPDLIADQQRALIDSAFEHATQVAEDHTLGPRFLFAHVLAPRSPLVYGAHGEALDLRVLRRTNDTAAGAGLTQQEFAERMVGQTQYVNGRTLELIDAILVASPDPPVIIVLSDHGSRSRTFNPSTPSDDELRERFATLFAAYTPGRTGVFPSDVAPAEVLGRLFEAYFGEPFDDPGTGIFASDASDPFRLTPLGDAPPSRP
jgi:hypothetical protein